GRRIERPLNPGHGQDCRMRWHATSFRLPDAARAPRTGKCAPDPSINTIQPTSTMSIEDRDLTKTYSRPQFVAKLRRLADTLEAGKPFTIQVAGEKLRIPADVVFNVEHERS